MHVVTLTYRNQLWIGKYSKILIYFHYLLDVVVVAVSSTFFFSSVAELDDACACICCKIEGPSVFFWDL